MSLSVNSTNYQPAFGSSRALSKAGNFAKNQIGHVFTQGAVWGFWEATNPSPNLTSALIRKVCIDFAEAIGKFISEKTIKPEASLTIGKQCTNVFAYIADGVRALGKIVKK